MTVYADNEASPPPSSDEVEQRPQGPRRFPRACACRCRCQRLVLWPEQNDTLCTACDSLSRWGYPRHGA